MQLMIIGSSGRIQSQVTEQYEKVQTVSLRRGKNLVLDLSLAGANRLGLRFIEKQFVVWLGHATEFFVEDREPIARNPNHRASKARRIRTAARLLPLRLACR